MDKLKNPKVIAALLALLVALAGAYNVDLGNLLKSEPPSVSTPAR